MKNEEILNSKELIPPKTFLKQLGSICLLPFKMTSDIVNQMAVGLGVDFENNAASQKSNQLND